MVRLTTIWNSKDIRFKLKYNLYHSLVLSILNYGCQSWTISTISTQKYKVSKTNLIENFLELHTKK